LAYAVALLVLGKYLNDSFLPPFELSGLWFYSAFAALILGEFVLEPFFTRPADALATGIAVVIGAASLSLDGAQVSMDAAETGRKAFLYGGLALIALASIAIVLKDSGGRAGSVARFATFVVGRVGRAGVVFSAVLFAAGYAAFADDAGKVAALYISWIGIFVVAPFERLALLLRRRVPKPKGATAVVERIEDPGIALVRLPPARACCARRPGRARKRQPARSRR
jgi:hypothetical protein